MVIVLLPFSFDACIRTFSISNQTSCGTQLMQNPRNILGWGDLHASTSFSSHNLGPLAISGICQSNPLPIEYLLAGIILTCQNTRILACQPLFHQFALIISLKIEEHQKLLEPLHAKLLKSRRQDHPTKDSSFLTL